MRFWSLLLLGALGCAIQSLNIILQVGPVNYVPRPRLVAIITSRELFFFEKCVMQPHDCAKIDICSIG